MEESNKEEPLLKADQAEAPLFFRNRGDSTQNRARIKRHKTFRDFVPNKQSNSLVFTRRWVFILFVVLCVVQGIFVQGAVWASVPRLSEQILPNLSDSDLSWQINANNIGQALVVPFSAWLLTTKRGLRNTMLLAGGFQVVQALLWAFIGAAPESFRESRSAEILVAMGAAIGGAGTAFTQGAPSRVSAVWFAPGNRAAATAAAYAGTYLGQSAGYILCFPGQGFELKKNQVGDADTVESHKEQWQAMLWVELVLSIILLVLPVMYFPDSPKEVADATASKAAIQRIASNDDEAVRPDPVIDEADELSFVESLKKVFFDKDCLLLLLSGGCVNGLYTAWQQELPIGTSRFSSMRNLLSRCRLVGAKTIPAP
jgi:hypothetical protein